MSESVYDKIYKYLSSKGISVYPPGMHKGECTEKYCVLKNDGSSPYGSFSSQVRYFTLMCYVPKNEYSELEEYVTQCEKALDELSPMIMPTGTQQPDYYDDTIKAHMRSIMYRNYKRNRLI